jgi:hypothetical protein
MSVKEGKIIQLTVPYDATIPDISLLTPTHTLFMIETMIANIKEFNKMSSLMTQNDIYNKVREETAAEIKKLELAVLIEKKYNEKVIEESHNYALKSQEEISVLRTQLKKSQCEFKTVNKEYIDEQIKIEKDKFDAILKEKERQNQLTRETIDKTAELINNLTAIKTAANIGREGELKFIELAETFNDFEEYEIVDKHKDSNKGDFHLFFKEFNVLADAKSYTTVVPTSQITKIKNDFMLNKHMHFAWLISLNTDIRGIKKSPVSYEIFDGRYIVYVNNLLQYNDPKKFLRILWSNCNELKRLIFDEETNDEPDKKNDELAEYKLLHKNEIEKIKGYMKNVNELSSTIRNLLKIIDTMQLSMKETIDEETKKITGEDVSDIKLLEDWWNKNVEFIEDETIILKSTDIWYKFKADTENEGKLEMINVQRFKQLLIQHLDRLGHHNYIRVKSKLSPVEIKNYRLINNTVKREPDEVIKKVKTMKVVTEKKGVSKTQLVLTIETERNILKSYMEDKKNIMEISETEECKPWEIVSLLVNKKVIQKRQDANGYDLYKETEEYKAKCVK